MRTPDALRYLDQVVDAFDPAAGLALPEQIARRVTLDVLPDRGDDDEPAAAWRRLLAALLRDRGAPRLRTLILDDWSARAWDPCDIPFEDADPNPALRRHPGRLARLERLFVGAFPAELPPRRGFCQGVAPALAGLPALAHLHLVGERGWDLVPAAGHPTLRTLILHVDEPDDDPLDALAGAPLPALVELDLWLGPALAEAALAGPLLDALAGAALERLALRGLDDPALLAGLGARAGLGERLTGLAVTDAPGLGDDAVAPLLAAAWLPRLARLDLRGTGVSPALVRELRARGPEVVAGTSTL